MASWVADARGADHEELQWQKYEDTTTGYWVSYSPKLVQYVDVGPFIHDAHCHAEGARKRSAEATYRPPANVSLLVHNLKTASGFDFAWRHTRAAAAPYDHKDCLQTILGRSPRARRRRRSRRREGAREGRRRPGGRGGEALEPIPRGGAPRRREVAAAASGTSTSRTLCGRAGSTPSGGRASS